MVGAVQVDDCDQIMMITDAGTLVRTRVSEVSIAGGGHKDVDALFVLADRQDGGNALIGFQRQQVDDRPTARAAAGFRQLIDPR